MDYQLAREQMVERQIVRRGIQTPRLLDALRAVPRHLFVPMRDRAHAYGDTPLPIGKGQTISQPYIVAYMTELLNLQGDEIILEIGTGSGYQAAILGELAAEVHTIERHEKLARTAQKLLGRLGYDNIRVHHGDGTLGLPEFAPYAAVMVTAAAPIVPRLLLEQLQDGGKLIMPVGERFGQVLELWQRQGEGFTTKKLTPVAFVPLLGKYGWESHTSKA